MANHLKVITRRVLSAKAVERVMVPLVTEKWGGAVKVRSVGGWIALAPDPLWGWTVEAPGIHQGTEIWMQSHRTLELRSFGGQWGSWVMEWLQHSLAAKLNGVCAFDSDRHDPKPQLMQTYRQHYNYPRRRPAGMLEDHMKWIRKRVPDSLLCEKPSRK